MPVSSGGSRRRSLIRNAPGNNWTDCIVWRRNDAGNGWNRVHSGLVIVQSVGSGFYTLNAVEPQPAQRQVTYSGAGVSAIEGYGPFSYSWVRTGGSSQMSVSNPGAANPIFVANVPKNQTVEATWRCDVYDAMTGRTVSLTRQIALSFFTNV